MRNRNASLPFILITVFIDVLGIGLMLPVLPALIGSLTGSPDLQSWWYGALLVTYGIVQFLCVPLLGALSDRYGRRPVLLLSIFGLGISYLITATTHSLPLLVVSRIISGATGASFTVASAYVADITPPEQRGRGFGAIGAAFGMGFIFGPVIGGLLGAVDLRLPFFVAAALSLLNWLYGFFVLPESLPAEKRAPVSLKRANPLGAFFHLAQLRGAGGLVWVFALTMLAQWVLHSSWVLYTSFRFGWGPQQNGMALFVVGVNAAIVQGLLLGRLIHRFGERRLALMAMTSAVVVYCGYGLANQGWMMYALILANFLSFASAPSLQALVSKAAAVHEQGVTQGALNAITSVMTVIGPLLSTPLLAMVAHLPPGDWRMGSIYFLCSALQATALVIAWRHFRQAPATAPVTT
ncbi:MAG: tetracycline-efflux transporter [Moraxellaceae bacterium]|jgi:DHA1 family tetracycline resistance protein-like MFS transporter|nr:tetracycline-efflux transporter [Moraxellaceae bacterium]